MPTLALRLALTPWIVCGLTVAMLLLRHRPEVRLLASGWAVGVSLGLGGAILGIGSNHPRARLACLLGFSAPALTIFPTGLGCLLCADLAG